MTPIARLFSAGLLVWATTGPALAQTAGEVTIAMESEEHVLQLWSEQSDWSGSESWPSISISPVAATGRAT